MGGSNPPLTLHSSVSILTILNYTIYTLGSLSYFIYLYIYILYISLKEWRKKIDDRELGEGDGEGVTGGFWNFEK